MSSTLDEQATFRRLANVLSQRIRRLVVFSGAGASREIGLPDWNTFIEKLFEQLEQSATAAIGEAYMAEVRRNLKTEISQWKRVSILKNNMKGYFPIAVRNVLESFSQTIPTFYSRVWDLNPDALLSVNLDGMSRRSYDVLKSGLTPDYLNGTSVGLTKIVLGASRKLIVDLHGTIENESTWVLTEEEKDKLLEREAYKHFLREIMSSNIVLFYGVSIEDVSITGQLNYLKEIGYQNGEYFLIRKKAEPGDWGISHSLGIQIIYLGEDLSWEDGFRRFVDTLLRHQAKDDTSPPVKVELPSVEDILPPEELVGMPPDEIRVALNSATNKFYHGEAFDYPKYKEFCDRYDSVIHLATRVTTSSPNNTWLGHSIVSELGKGNFGRVFSASDKVGGSVAIKVAHPDVRDDEVMLNSFRRGVESMRILTDSQISGVVGIKDASELPPSIIMNYVEGIDFERYAIEFQHVDVSEKLKIIKWICEILFACHTHEKFVLHRDLRPSNVMISGEYWDRVCTKSKLTYWTSTCLGTREHRVQSFI